MKRVLRSQEDYRTSILRNLLTSLILFEAITTTKAKAKMLVSYANRFFNRTRINDLNAKRLASQTLYHKNAVKKLFEEILPRYEKSDSNFIRIIASSPRSGDAAPQATIVLLKTFSAKIEKITEVKADNLSVNKKISSSKVKKLGVANK